jgi:hypothetical protein
MNKIVVPNLWQGVTHSGVSLGRQTLTDEKQKGIFLISVGDSVTRKNKFYSKLKSRVQASVSRNKLEHRKDVTMM